MRSPHQKNWDDITGRVEELFFNPQHNKIFGDKTPVGKALLRLVEVLKLQQLDRVSLGGLVDILSDGDDPVDDTVTGNVIQYATGVPGLLTLGFEMDPDGKTFEVPLARVQAARQSGVLILEDGRTIWNWESQVYIIFKRGDGVPPAERQTTFAV